ncbi:MAG: hypothetical protein ABI672_04220 [Vicinamibacteria bacterium]
MAIVDGLVVALAGLLAAAFYAPHVGFYSDDWVLLASFHLAPDQSIAGLYTSTHAQHFASRPIQGLYSILLYKAFGLAPLGYQVVNALVLAASAVLLRGVLARLGASRLAALGAGLVFACVPAFSTDRFWFAAFAAPLSVALYLVSLRMDLASARAEGASLVGWRAASLSVLAVGLLGYELALPLAFFSPGVARFQAWREGQTSWSWGRWATWVLPTLALLVGLGIYKAEDSGRLGSLDSEPKRIERILTGLLRSGAKDGDYGLNFPRAVAVNFGDHVLRLPSHAWALQGRVRTPALPVAVIVLALAAIGYLLRAARGERWAAGHWALMAAAGLGVFVLGYTIFLTNNAIQITPTGVGNRSSLAAAIGLAMVVAGVLGWLVSVLPLGAARAPVFATALTFYLSCGVFTTVALASYWADAYSWEQVIIADIQAHLKDPAPKSTIFLGGVCPYVGPAIVFESSWDLAFALRIAYHDPTVSADVVSRSFSAGRTAISTSLYDEEYDWPYGPATILYDYRTKQVVPLVDQTTTLQALRRLGLPSPDCPPSKEGVGVSVF